MNELVSLHVVCVGWVDTNHRREELSNFEDVDSCHRNDVKEFELLLHADDHIACLYLLQTVPVHSLREGQVARRIQIVSDAEEPGHCQL